jgi:hypothetical protein
MGGATRGRQGDIDSLAATVLLQHALRSAELEATRNTAAAGDEADDAT